ncbi:hypothetical protein L596_015678 [Steinernema carpocapsae]|uniref:Uncharacterized protein n=1 Tax=Steinernema carpocapsae TaxID=34508 RepID=A0A4U5NFR3_STECR|nr:hypothetical protein L596_015678 [Steinernema carpocapsae]
MSSSRSSHSSSVSSGITRTSEYDREYRRQDRRLLYEVVERATNAYLNSAETMNLSMNLTIDFIDASANSISVMPGVEYRAPRINISFDKLKHGRSKEAPRSETKSVSGQSISEVSISRISPDSSTTPEKRAAGGASRGNLHKKSEAELRIEDFDDFEEFERGARDDRPAYRKKMADGNEMASLRRGLAVRRRLPTGDPFPVIQESAEVGKRGEALEPKSFWSKKVDDEFTIVRAVEVDPRPDREVDAKFEGSGKIRSIDILRRRCL